MQQHAVRMVGELRQRTDDEKAADAQRAVTELHTAVRLFEALEKKAHTEKTGFEAKNVAVHHKFCHSSLQSAQRQQEQVGRAFSLRCTDREPLDCRNAWQLAMTNSWTAWMTQREY